MSARPNPPGVERRLRSNTIGLPGVLFQSITTMAPAGAIAFAFGAAIPFTGIALPLAVVIALVVCALIALCIGSLAKHLPSAGGYLTYVSRSLGSSAGWMTGWLCNLSYVAAVPFTLLGQGFAADSFVTSTFHVSLGWAAWAVISAVVVFSLTYFGIKFSANAGVVLGVVEIAVFVLLSAWLIVTAGSNNTAAVFNPASSPQSEFGGWQGVLFGMIFVFLAFGGFESSAPLAEEARNPRRTVPRAILLAAVCIGLLYLFCSYAGIVGWGTGNITAYASDENPWGTMAKRVWGPFSVVVFLAILNSGLACANGNVNAATRVLYAMGRTQTLPPAFAHLNRFRVPDIAIFVTMLAAVIFSLWPGFVYGPKTAYALLGTLTALPIIAVYIATCISVPFFYRRERPQEFSVVRHIFVPLVPLVVLTVVLCFQFVPPPAPPLNLAGPIFAAWFLLGIIVVLVLRFSAPQSLAASNSIYVEPEEV